MKLAMIAILYAIGMLVWLLWKFGSKKETKKFMDEVYDIDGINILPENIVILLVVVVAIVVSALWPTEIVTFPYQKLRKLKKNKSS